MDGLQTSMVLDGLNSSINIPKRGLKAKKGSLLLMHMRVINLWNLSTTALKTTSFPFGCLLTPPIYFNRSMLVALVLSKLHTQSRLSTWSETGFTILPNLSFYLHLRRRTTKHLQLVISKAALEDQASIYLILKLYYMTFTLF